MYGVVILNSLVHELQLQIAGAQGHGFRNALGDEATFDARQARKGDGGAVVSVEALGLHHVLADDAEAAFAAMLLSVLLGGKLGSCGRGKEPDSTVGEHSIHVKQQQLDLARSLQ